MQLKIINKSNKYKRIWKINIKLKMLLKIINKNNKFKTTWKTNLKLKNNKNNQINKTNYKKII